MDHISLKVLAVKQQGAVLPSVLGVLLLVFLLSATINNTVASQQKIGQAYQDQRFAEQQAQFGLVIAERAVLALDDQPTAQASLQTSPAGQVELNIIGNALSDYALSATTNLLTGQRLDWSEQPSRWWQQYANTHQGNTPAGNLSADPSQSAYSIVEEYQQDTNGQELGQARHYYATPTKMLYQITSRGEGRNQGVSRLRVITAQVFY